MFNEKKKPNQEGSYWPGALPKTTALSWEFENSVSECRRTEGLTLHLTYTNFIFLEPELLQRLQTVHNVIAKKQAVFYLIYYVVTACLKKKCLGSWISCVCNINCSCASSIEF